MASSVSFENYFQEYWRDAYERSILFLDILGQRGEAYRAQEARTAPNVLNFEAEVLIDGRTLAVPVNYALVRIVPPAGVVVDNAKRPFIVFDPRAGHGPGIGGMKHDSEIGVALRAGHPCYFVGFLPKPVEGQTIEDVCRAEAHFVRTVSDRHPNANGKPVLIGNCQAGWQIMMMAAMDPDLAGPILIAGAPLSYWAGVRGKNPMRYLGGMLGGSWLTHMASDLGNGIFDGANLIANFESNNPANTLWTKPYNVYSHVDTEGPRYLEFEKWWGSPVLLNGEEIQFIVDELFVGNHLTAGKVVLGGEPIDLRKIKSPIIVFCSFGDDITPPQQALDWILDLYRDVDDIVAHGQTIVYSVHPSIGHLGIFVSGKIAKKEHEEFAFNMDLIDVMPAGLYEIVMTGVNATTHNPELISGQYVCKLEPRTLDDIRALGCNDAADERRFATAARISEINNALYSAYLQPAIQKLSSPATAEFLRETHPNRVSFRAFANHNPMMAPISAAAKTVKANRHPVSGDNPLLTCEKIASSWIVTSLDIFAKWREAVTETTFLTVYGAPSLQAAVGIAPAAKPAKAPKAAAAVPKTSAELSQGGQLEAGLRALLYLQTARGADERQFNAIEALRNRMPEGERISVPQLKDKMQSETALLRASPGAALAAITDMLPKARDRRAKLLDHVFQVATADGPLTPDQVERLERIKEVFNLTSHEVAALPAPRKIKAVG